MAPVRRFIVESGQGHEAQVRTALQGIAKLVQDRKIAHVTLVVPKKGGWENTIIAKALGAPAAKALTKGQAVRIGDGATMDLEGTTTFRSSSSQGLLVGVHISIKDMAKLNDASGAQGIMYLPWIDSEAEEWKATWNPETVGPKGAAAKPSSLSKPVEDALTRLTQTINLGTGLGHPSDKKHAERTFDKLKADGHFFDPAEVRRWAQRHRWSSGAAAELEAVARKRT